jgi:hypothetical protein
MEVDNSDLFEDTRRWQPVRRLRERFLLSVALAFLLFMVAVIPTSGAIYAGRFSPERVLWTVGICGALSLAFTLRCFVLRKRLRVAEVVYRMGV